MCGLSKQSYDNGINGWAGIRWKDPTLMNFRFNWQNVTIFVILLFT